MKSVLWRVAKRLSCTEDARCLKVKRAKKCQSAYLLTPIPYKTWAIFVFG